MKALILNSGTGSRMGSLTHDHPKCMVGLINGETILSRQIVQLESADIKEIVITTGYYDNQIKKHAEDVVKNAHLTFVNNPKYDETNYIYSIYLAREHLQNDILMLHGDLVFGNGLIEELISFPGSAMTVSSTSPLPDKDFKAVINNTYISAVGVEFFNSAMTAQPLYKLNKNDWYVWLEEICRFIELGKTTCYAENAFNAVSEFLRLLPFDVKNRLCAEIDTPDDLKLINNIIGGKKNEKGLHELQFRHYS